MRTVKAYGWSDYLRREGKKDEELPLPFQSWGRSLRELYYGKGFFFQPLTLAAYLLAASAVLAVAGVRGAQVAFIAETALLAALFVQARAIAHGLEIARRLPPRAIERERLQASWVVTNASPFAVHDLELYDRFTGTSRPDLRKLHPDPILPGASASVELEVRCDAGMGRHRFGPCVAVVTDALGIFRFSVTEDEPAEIEVLPEYISIEGFGVPAALQSASAGLFESPVKGESVAFLGVREYRAGDPYKRINWRLSAKRQELVVNEFESSVNADLNLCLDLDETQHLGRGAESTWEYAKDVAISLLHERLAGVSRVRLLSQELETPFGAGYDHAHGIIRQVSRLGPARGPGGALLKRAFESAPYGSSLLYIASVYQNDVDRVMDLFGALREKGVGIACVLVDGRGFARELSAVNPWLAGAVSGSLERAGETLDALLYRGGRLGARMHVIERGASIPLALLEPRAGGGE